MTIQRKRRGGVVARPLNCDEMLGTSQRCPHCNQFHLRPGYCQALDPINADKYPHLHGGTAETDQGDESSVTHSVTHPASVTQSCVTGLASVTHPPEADASSVTHPSATCRVCGTAFAPKHPRAKFCSPACRQKSHRRGPEKDQASE